MHQFLRKRCSISSCSALRSKRLLNTSALSWQPILALPKNTFVYAHTSLFLSIQLYWTTGFPNRFWTTFGLWDYVRLFWLFWGHLKLVLVIDVIWDILGHFRQMRTFETLIQNLLGHPVLGNLLQQFLVSFSLVQLFMRLECRRTMKL